MAQQQINALFKTQIEQRKFVSPDAMRQSQTQEGHSASGAYLLPKKVMVKAMRRAEAARPPAFPGDHPLASVQLVGQPAEIQAKVNGWVQRKKSRAQGTPVKRANIRVSNPESVPRKALAASKSPVLPAIEKEGSLRRSKQGSQVAR